MGCRGEAAPKADVLRADTQPSDARRAQVRGQPRAAGGGWFCGGEASPVSPGRREKAGEGEAGEAAPTSPKHTPSSSEQSGGQDN